MKPSTPQRFCRLVLHAVVAFHYVGTPDENFAVSGNPDFLVSNSAADGSEAHHTWPVKSDDRRSLRQPISFEDGQPDGPKEFRNVLIQSSATGDEKQIGRASCRERV